MFYLQIRDFGRSRNLENEYYISHGGGMPLRWTAPEAVTYQKFSTASDVWSYGCLLYEIWSTGTLPFEDCNKDSEVCYRYLIDISI